MLNRAQLPDNVDELKALLSAQFTEVEAIKLASNAFKLERDAIQLERDTLLLTCLLYTSPSPRD